MSEHTPTPWHTEECGDPGCWCLMVTGPGDPDDMTNCVAAGGALGRANAEFIVLAVNAHDDLLAACEGLLAVWDNPHTKEPLTTVTAALKAMRAAVAKAKGGEL